MSNSKDNTPELLFDKIRRRAAGNWDDSDELLVRYVVNYIDQVKEITVSELALNTGNTASAVHNLCHKLGYFGFNEFKHSVLQFHSIITNDHAPTGNQIPISNTIEQLSTSVSTDLAQYLSHLDLPTLNKVVQIMRESLDVLILTDERTALSAAYLAQQFKAVHKNALVMDPVNTNQSLINTALKMDYIIMFSVGDNSISVQAKVDQLKDLEKPFILFTISSADKLIPLVSTAMVIAQPMHKIGTRTHEGYQLNTFALIDLLGLLI